MKSTTQKILKVRKVKRGEWPGLNLLEWNRKMAKLKRIKLDNKDNI